MSSSSLFLTPDSSAVEELCTVLAPTTVDLKSGCPIFYWVTVEYNCYGITLTQKTMKLPDQAASLNKSLDNLKKILSSLFSLDFFKNPLCLTYLRDTAPAWHSPPLSPLNIFQILASLVVFLKNQHLYCSQDPSLLPSDREALLMRLHYSIMPILENAKSRFITSSPNLYACHSTSFVPSLQSLAALAVLHTPLNQEDSPPSHCSCRSLHLCFSDDLKAHPAITMLSPLIRAAFENVSLATLANSHLTLSLAVTLGEKPPTLTLEQSSSFLPFLNLLPLSFGGKNDIQLRRLIQERLTLTALSYPQMKGLNSFIPQQALIEKFSGPLLMEPYELLKTMRGHFRSSTTLYLPRHIFIMSTMNEFFLKTLTAFSYEESSLAAPLQVRSITKIITKTVQSLLEVSSQSIYILKHPNQDHQQILAQLADKQSHCIIKNIALLTKVAHMSIEHWLLDLLSEMKNSLLLGHDLLLSTATTFGIDLAPISNPLTSSPEALLSLQNLQIATGSSTRSSALKNKPHKKLKVSFLQN
ncbi:hypothetical protein CLAVI_000118 [Candidatus Clavichlamydia salmonicola]|uniref:hypothetical protein n=1 Tax=Candidatus Clavichlamydia salmonicola TaxID=469812 RepID=UPI0018914F01|nr:hypothetical protein [Candidatus Clavichlamydia salmonicola]MBF5050512.1 hypothetical protein [Candidatus Clavichlamydia salmonicola]